MEEQNDYGLFDDGFIEPKAEQKAALIRQLQSGDYHLSFSGLSAFAISPRYFIAYKLQEKVTTKAMILGQAVHSLVLEPDVFNDQFFIAPNVNGGTVAGKAAWHKIYCDFVEDVPAEGFKMVIADIIKAVQDKTKVTVLPGTVAEDAQARARALIRNRACRSVLDQITSTELKLPEDFRISGIRFKGSIDGKGERIMMDLKNMPDATLQKSQGSVWSRRLHWQGMIYDNAYNGGYKFHVLCVDKAGETCVHVFNDHHLVQAERQVKKYLEYFVRTIWESNFDPGIWDMSQDFWLRSDMNTHGINYL